MHPSRFLRAVTFVAAMTGLVLAACSPPGPGPAVSAAPTQVSTQVPTELPTPPKPTAAPTPEGPAPAISTVMYEDEINDPIDCVTGEPFDGVLRGYMDIHAIRVEIREADVTWVWVMAPDTDLAAMFAANPLAGGLGFADPSQPMPPADVEWYFNNVANSGFGFIWNRDTKLLDGYDSVYSADGWASVEGFITQVVFGGNEIRVTLPWEHIPAGAPWYGSTTNGVLCDQAGLVSDLPTLAGPLNESLGETY